MEVSNAFDHRNYSASVGNLSRIVRLLANHLTAVVNAHLASTGIRWHEPSLQLRIYPAPLVLHEVAVGVDATVGNIALVFGFAKIRGLVKRRYHRGGELAEKLYRRILRSISI